VTKIYNVLEYNDDGRLVAGYDDSDPNYSTPPILVDQSHQQILTIVSKLGLGNVVLNVTEDDNNIESWGVYTLDGYRVGLDGDTPFIDVRLTEERTVEGVGTGFLDFASTPDWVLQALAMDDLQNAQNAGHDNTVLRVIVDSVTTPHDPENPDNPEEGGETLTYLSSGVYTLDGDLLTVLSNPYVSSSQHEQLPDSTNFYYGADKAVLTIHHSGGEALASGITATYSVTINTVDGVDKVIFQTSEGPREITGNDAFLIGDLLSSGHEVNVRVTTQYGSDPDYVNGVMVLQRPPGPGEVFNLYMQLNAPESVEEDHYYLVYNNATHVVEYHDSAGQLIGELEYNVAQNALDAGLENVILRVRTTNGQSIMEIRTDDEDYALVEQYPDENYSYTPTPVLEEEDGVSVDTYYYYFGGRVFESEHYGLHEDGSIVIRWYNDDDEVYTSFVFSASHLPLKKTIYISDDPSEIGEYEMDQASNSWVYVPSSDGVPSWDGVETHAVIRFDAQIFEEDDNAANDIDPDEMLAYLKNVQTLDGVHFEIDGDLSQHLQNALDWTGALDWNFKANNQTANFDQAENIEDLFTNISVSGHRNNILTEQLDEEPFSLNIKAEATNNHISGNMMKIVNLGTDDSSNPSKGWNTIYVGKNLDNLSGLTLQGYQHHLQIILVENQAMFNNMEADQKGDWHVSSMDYPAILQMKQVSSSNFKGKVQQSYLDRGEDARLLSVDIDDGCSIELINPDDDVELVQVTNHNLAVIDKIELSDNQALHLRSENDITINRITLEGTTDASSSTISIYDPSAVTILELDINNDVDYNNIINPAIATAGGMMTFGITGDQKLTVYMMNHA